MANVLTIARLEAYRKAEMAIIGGAQEYRVEDKYFKKADLELIQAMIKSLEGQIAGGDPSRKRMRSQRVLPKRY